MKMEIQFGAGTSGVRIEGNQITFYSNYSGSSAPLSVEEWRKLVSVVESVLEIEGVER